MQIIDAIKETLDRTPPELASDIMDRGIMLAGGGSLLQGLDERLREETQMPAHRAESPLTCVAVGSGRSARGVRGDPPLQPHPTTATGGLAASLTLDHLADPSLHPRMHDRAVRRRRAVLAVARRGLADPAHRLFRRVLRRPPALRAARRDGGRWRRSRRAPTARSSRSATCSAGSATRSTPRASATSCAGERDQLRQQLAQTRRSSSPSAPAAGRAASSRTPPAGIGQYQPVARPRLRALAEHLVPDA